MGMLLTCPITLQVYYVLFEFHFFFCYKDVDSHSVTSSVGSDTISSVSQDGNRLSVATSGYSSDPSRATKLSFSGNIL